MTTITQLKRIVETVRSLPDRSEKESYLNQQSREILNFLGSNITKDGIAKATANEIPIISGIIDISITSESSMEDIINYFGEASKYSKKIDKNRMMNMIFLTPENREFVITTLFGSLKLGLKIPLPNPVFGEVIKPQLCKTGEFNTENYIEEKFDGLRNVCTNNNGTIINQSRNGKILNIKFSDDFKNAIPPGCTVDGEVIDSTGNFFNLKRDSDDLIYMIFDIIFKDKKSITNLSLKDRLVILNETITENDHVKISPELNLNTQENIDNWIVKFGAEGIIIKDLNASYDYGGRKNFIKYKHFQDITCSVVGFTRGTGKRDRDDMIGALEVIPEGFDTITKVGSGYTDEDLIYIKSLLDQNKNIKIDVKYQDITPDNKSLRFPIFLRIREIT